jgi:predicted amidophosphoribosyltransferase
VISCTQCGHPLPADAEFCPSCGKAAEQPANGDGAPADATVIGSEAVKPDRWEE